MPRLIIDNGSGVVSYHEILPTRTLIGRDPTCNVMIVAKGVSRFHCSVEQNGGRYWVHDHSTNGTFVNQRPVPRGRCLELRDEDVLRVGVVDIDADIAERRVNGSGGPTDQMLYARHQPPAEPASPVPRRDDAEFEFMIGGSPVMRDVFYDIRRFGPREATVLVTGPTGTGKELVARALHLCSPRASQRMITVNCGAIPRDLAESQLFGHVRGAFTGAVGSHVGWVEQASGGTLFLDEVGDLPVELQVKLLRLLQEREIQPVGASEPRKVDIRIIAATHRNLGKMCEEGTFRLDLYHRLATLTISVPPLSQRIEDLPRVILALLARHGEPIQITSEAIGLLQRHNWPGNVRELDNVLMAAAARAEGGVLGPEAFQHLSWAARLSVLADPNRLMAALLDAGSARALATVLDVPRETLRRALVTFGIASPTGRGPRNPTAAAKPRPAKKAPNKRR